MAMKTRTPLWSMKMPDLEPSQPKSDAPFGQPFLPSAKELECTAAYFGNKKFGEFFSLKKCFKNGERFVAGVSFLMFQHAQRERVGKVMK